MTGQFPGNTDAIDGEIRRLHDLKERLWSTGDGVRQLGIERWTGGARDAFEDFRYAFANQWFAAGDRHEDAARALERYQLTLLDLQRRAATAEPTPEELSRWHQQLSSEATAAATAIRAAARALAATPRLLTDAPSATAAPEPAGRTAPARHVDPRTAGPDRAGFHEGVRELCADLGTAPVTEVRPL